MRRRKASLLLFLCIPVAASVLGMQIGLLWEAVRRAGHSSWSAALPHFWNQTVNTLLLTCAAVIISLPLAFFCGVWLLRTRHKRCKRMLLHMLSALAGVPSAVYGLFGYLLFGGVCALGYSLLTGALTAALLLLPTTVFLLWDALRRLGDTSLRSALALGAPEGRAVCGVLLPQAGHAIYTAAFLAASRVAAESAALILTAGIGETSARGLRRFLQSGATLSVGMFQSILEGETELAFSAGVLLLLLAALLDALSHGR